VVACRGRFSSHVEDDKISRLELGGGFRRRPGGSAGALGVEVSEEWLTNLFGGKNRMTNGELIQAALAALESEDPKCAAPYFAEDFACRGTCRVR